MDRSRSTNNGVKDIGGHWYEVRCYGCGELMLIKDGEMVPIITTSSRGPYVLCAHCHRRGQEEVE